MTAPADYHADPRWIATRDEWVADKPVDVPAATHFVNNIFRVGRMYRIEAAYELLGRVPTDEEVAAIPDPDLTDVGAAEGVSPR